LLLAQLHNPCLIYWVSPVEYIQVLTLLDLNFCRYHSSYPWILLRSRPLTRLGVVNDSVSCRYMEVAHPCISYHELCYVERLLLDFDVDYDM
jgi:hypothetical protein